MAFSSCISNLAANIAMKCDTPLVAGYTGRGILIPVENISAITLNATNPRKVEAITLVTSGKVCVADDLFDVPFEGTTVASSADAGFAQYTKTLGVHIPERGADVAMNIIEPLQRSHAGFIAILERKDKVGDGSFVCFGVQNAMHGTADGFTQDETANGGAWMGTLTTTESWAEVTLSPTPGTGETAYGVAKEAFDDLWSSAF